MNALHLSQTAGLVVTSFGAGIGLVTAIIVLNFIADTMRRAKERKNRLPALSEQDLRRLAQRQTKPQPSPGYEPSIPMIVPHRDT
ncbi:MAG: hypothetical protein FJX74_08745 [Armatimonadetes bacterium]|nr:hypothetical protein [Armatimonadota bacterium]